jgi:hypothetical protein
MKRILLFLFALLLPLSIFAQPRQADENGLLQGFGLNDSQIAQVMDIQKTTRDLVKADLTHIRLIQAQISEAMLPANPDVAAINALIDKKGAFRSEIEKSLMSARLQLIKLVGKENADKYFNFVMRSIRPRLQDRFGGRGMGMGQARPMPAPDQPGPTSGD